MKRERTIYFSGAIRGGRKLQRTYGRLIDYLEGCYGEVLTKHIGTNLTTRGESNKNDVEIYTRNIDLLEKANVVIGEITIPSFGVGYEAGYVEFKKKPHLFLYQPYKNKRLSAMATGNIYFNIRPYNTLTDATGYIDDFFSKLAWTKI
jgi:2'-deoxynucleoside 5'-phosphate N-hydrolase